MKLETEGNYGSGGLDHSLKLYRAAQKIASLGYWVLDIGSGELEWSEQLYRIFGIPPENVISDFESFLECVHSEDRSNVVNLFNSHLISGENYELVHRILTKDGSVKWIQERCETEYDDGGRPIKSFGTVLDVTKQVMAERRLQETVKQKELLIQELYHRTRNNMQLIISMLNLFASDGSPGDYGRFLKNTERRIQIMSLAHERLIDSNDLSVLNMKDYFRDIIMAMRYQEADRRGLEIRHYLDDINVTIDVAIPCGIILGELLMNSIEHGMSCGRDRALDVRLFCFSGECRFSVADRGCGLSEAIGSDESYSRGLKMICLLTESQLGGRVEVSSGELQTCSVIFSLNPHNRRV